jgi:hypothetical protein
MKSDNGGTFEINSRDHLEIRDYLGKRYVCLKFERLGKDGNAHINRMNFHNTAWETLMEKDLKEKKKTKKTMKRRQIENKEQEKCKKRLFETPSIQTIRQYKYEYGEQTSPYWYFTEELCRENADFVENPQDVSIITRECQAPSVLELFNMIATFLVTCEIKTIMAKNCYGCQGDHSSQVHHMGFGGCMEDWPDTVRDNIEEASNVVTLEKAWNACTTVMNILGLSVDNAPKEVCITEEDVRDQTIPSDYQNLFLRVL